MNIDEILEEQRIMVMKSDVLGINYIESNGMRNSMLNMIKDMFGLTSEELDESYVSYHEEIDWNVAKTVDCLESIRLKLGHELQEHQENGNTMGQDRATRLFHCVHMKINDTKDTLFSIDNKMWECRTLGSIHDKDGLGRTRVEIKAFIPHKGFVQKHRISSLVIRLEKEKAISNNTYMKEWRLEFVAIGNPEIDRIMQKGKDNYVMWIEAMKDIYRKMGKDIVVWLPEKNLGGTIEKVTYDFD